MSEPMASLFILVKLNDGRETWIHAGTFPSIDQAEHTRDKFRRREVHVRWHIVLLPFLWNNTVNNV